MKKLSALVFFLFIFFLFARLPLDKVLAVSYILDEYGRLLLVDRFGQVLGEETSGMMPETGSQQPQAQQQQRQQPQMQQQQGQSSQQQQQVEPQQGKSLQQMQQLYQRTYRGTDQQGQQEQRLKNATPDQKEQMKKGIEQMRIQATNGQLRVEGPAVGGTLRTSGQNQAPQGPIGSSGEDESSRESGSPQFGESGLPRTNNANIPRPTETGSPREAGASGMPAQAGQPLRQLFGTVTTPVTNVESIKIKESSEKNTVEIKARGDQMELNQQGTRAKTNFPISVGTNNELIVTTPNGEQKTVTVLPNEAVKEVLKNGAISKFGNFLTGSTQTTPTEIAGSPREAGASGTTGAEVPQPQVEANASGQEVELTQENNGKLEYKVSGTKEAKFLGFFPVQGAVETRVSAETGAVTSVVQPWYFSSFGFLFR